LSFKILSNYKMVLVLLFVVAINLIVSVLVWYSDFFVHGELYRYGLIYSLDWADPYWVSTAMLWAVLGGATIFAAMGSFVHYFPCREVNRFSKWSKAGEPAVMHYVDSKYSGRLLKWTMVLLPLLALAFEGICIFYFDQKSSIVWNTLKDYGLRNQAEWVTTYNFISVPAVMLMAVALLVLVIPAVVAASSESMVRRSNNSRRVKASIAPQIHEETVEPPQKIVQSLESPSKTSTAFEKEEINPEDPTVLQSPIPIYSSERLSTEQKKPEIAKAEPSTAAKQKTTKKRRKRSRRKRRQSRSRT